MAAENKPKLLVVLGPTASGKTGLAIRLAQQFGGEIISADSMQIYRGLDIGTAKATAAEQAAVPHHLIDIRDPDQLFSVAEYCELAHETIQKITARGKLPILAGGTGLYLSSVLDGIHFSDEPEDGGIRARLAEEAEHLGDAAMYEKLQRIDPETARGIHPNNRKRVLRALELYEKTGQTMSDQRRCSRPDQRPYDALVLGLNYPDREQLYEKIGIRVDQMLTLGLLEEAKLVFDHRDQWVTAAQAIGYKELFPVLEGTGSLDSCIAQLKQATRNYAKRQLTWFRRMQETIWLDAGNPHPEELVQQFLS